VLVVDTDLSGELVITVKSPVTVHAYDAEGNHLGLDAQGELENEIGEGVFYSMDAEHQTIRIINHPDVIFKLVGQEEGTFSVDALRVDEQGNVTARTFEDIPTAPGVTYVLDSSAPEWELEQEGTGEAASCFPALFLLGMAALVQVYNRRV
jgi:hypothetical protein